MDYNKYFEFEVAFYGTQGHHTIKSKIPNIENENKTLNMSEKKV